MNSLQRLGRAHLFLFQMLAGVVVLLPRFGIVIRQLYFIGVHSLLIVIIAGIFIGMVLG